MSTMGASTTCGRLHASDGGSRNKSAYGGRPVSATCHRGTPPFLSFVTSHIILYLTSGPVVYCYSFIHHYSLQALQKIHVENHIHSLTELLHSDAMQQMEVALLGLPAAKLLNILSISMQSTASTQHQAAPIQPQTVPFHPLATTSIYPSPPPFLLCMLQIQRGQLMLQPLSVGCRHQHLLHKKNP